MEYELFLKYNESMSIGLHGHWGDLCKHTWADIMYWSGETDEEINDEENEGTKIGHMTWLTYNQTLARVHNVNMDHVGIFKMLQGNRKVWPDLDYANISQETIEEIGETSNPNIVILIHFGISADWRKKRLGEEVLKGFIEQMLGKCGYIVIAHNEPSQFGQDGDKDGVYALHGISLNDLEKDPEKAQWKLNAFWQRCGFKQFKNHENIFICNVEQTVPKLVKSQAAAI